MRASTLHLGEPASVDPELTVSVFRCLSFPIPKGGGVALQGVNRCL